jgi:hypothetical protein
MAKAAVGIRVKSGWASAVVVSAGGDGLRFLSRARLLLSDPHIPKSAQPYHRGFGTLQKDRAVLRRLTRVVHAAAARSLRAPLKQVTAAGHRPAVVALVVGSTIDPQRITNEHIRAHACEAQLFRTALARAAQRLALRCTVTRERDLGGIATAALGAGAATRLAGLRREAGRPWRADEKLATLAAWVALA